MLRQYVALGRSPSIKTINVVIASMDTAVIRAIVDVFQISSVFGVFLCSSRDTISPLFSRPNDPRYERRLRTPGTKKNCTQPVRPLILNHCCRYFHSGSSSVCILTYSFSVSFYVRLSTTVMTFVDIFHTASNYARLKL